MFEKLEKIRADIDEIKKIPLILRAKKIEELVETQYQLMVDIVNEINFLKKRKMR